MNVSTGITPEQHSALRGLDEKPTFLMVGTLEKRKGYEQALKAFEIAWNKNAELNLIIVGRPGWGTEAVQKRLHAHQAHNKRLFWFENASDELLNLLYEKCSCLLYASYGEGFGLPLIEAEAHGLPVLARDLPIFREVGSGQTNYFAAETPEELYCALIEQSETTTHQRKSRESCRSWGESARQILSLL